MPPHFLCNIAYILLRFRIHDTFRLMVNILFYDDNDILSGNNVAKTIYDPACGTGGMLSVAEEYLHPFINTLFIENKKEFNALYREALKLFPELNIQINDTYAGREFTKDDLK